MPYPADPYHEVYREHLKDGRLALCACHDDTRLVICDTDDEVTDFMEEHDLVFAPRPKRRRSRARRETLPHPRP